MLKFILPGMYTIVTGLVFIFKFRLVYYMFIFMTYPVMRVFETLFPSSGGSISGSREGITHAEYYVTTIFSNHPIPIPFEQFPLAVTIMLSAGMWFWIGIGMNKILLKLRYKNP